MIVCVGSPYHYIAFKISVGFSGDYRKFWFTTLHPFLWQLLDHKYDIVNINVMRQLNQ